jgi:Ca2+-binding EF-hand superfamily protein
MKTKNIGIIAAVSLLSMSLNLGIAEEVKSPAKKEVKKSSRSADRPSRESIVKRFDKDGDGKLSESERAAARKAMGSRTNRGGNRQSQDDLQKQRRARYDAFVKNIREQVKAGKVTEEQARERIGQLRQRMAQASGGGSQNERSRGARERLMKEFDKNKDGKLDEKERAALRKSMSERSSRGGRGGEGAERSSRGRRGGEGAERSSRGRRGGEGAERSSRGRRGGEGAERSSRGRRGGEGAERSSRERRGRERNEGEPRRRGQK